MKAARASSRLASGRAKRTLSPIVPSNRNTSCGTTSRLRRSEAGSATRRSIPPTSTVPRVGSAIRATSLPSVLLPDPVAPTSAARVPGRSSKLMSCRTRSPVG